MHLSFCLRLFACDKIHLRQFNLGFEAGRLLLVVLDQCGILLTRLGILPALEIQRRKAELDLRRMRQLGRSLQECLLRSRMVLSGAEKICQQETAFLTIRIEGDGLAQDGLRLLMCTLRSRKTGPACSR